jgi:hypothetical protein
LNNVEVYKHLGHPVKIEQTQVQRSWMDNTDDKHAYKCFPVSLVNTIGWSISFLEDIEFIWDGISDTSEHHVKILKGPEGVCNTQRGNATVSFYTGLYFKTEENMTMLSIVPPNYFIDGATPFTSLITTSFFEDALPVAWRVTRPNEKITIPAGTPVITVIPISLGELAKVELDIHDKVFNEEMHDRKQKRLEVWEKLSKEGKFTNFYRNAVEYDGSIMGKHEKKSLHLRINDFSTDREVI